MDTPNTDKNLEPQGRLPDVAGSALDEQRNALAEARLRIIARYEHVDTWLTLGVPENIAANWRGITEGLRQARRIIGGMWDELPVPKPQSVIDHQARASHVMSEITDQPGNQCSSCLALSELAHWECLCPGEVPGCIGSAITVPNTPALAPSPTQKSTNE